MQQHYYPEVGETVFSEVLNNGLSVYILPKPGFQKTFATFATKYGSIDNHFAVGHENFGKVPDGIAHFLEHKMFEEPEGDVFATFAANGASANAYTSFERTVYLFSATDHIAKNVSTLLNFVQNPYFTDENVHKEKGIIGQEIKMYQDHPDWRAYFGLIENMYHVHPVHIDIAGTLESIAEITKETLYRCYHTFYHPQNMCLFIVGNVDPSEMIKLVCLNQDSKSFAPLGQIQRKFESEPESVKRKQQVIRLPVAMTKCLFGLKEGRPTAQDDAQLSNEIVTKLLFDLLFSPSSGLYQLLYDEKLITDNFGAEYNTGTQYAFSVMGGDTRDPDLLVTKVTDWIEKWKQSGVPAAEFERARRKKMGNFIRMLNSPEAIASEFTKHHFRGTHLFEIVRYYEEMRLEQLEERLREHFDWGQLTTCIIKSE
jgi:predicted Zn-dependent peptidase